MLGADLFNGARGLYKTMQIVADLHGLEAIVASLGEHFAKASRASGTCAGVPEHHAARNGVSTPISKQSNHQARAGEGMKRGPECIS